MQHKKRIPKTMTNNEIIPINPIRKIGHWYRDRYNKRVEKQVKKIRERNTITINSKSELNKYLHKLSSMYYELFEGFLMAMIIIIISTSILITLELTSSQYFLFYCIFIVGSSSLISFILTEPIRIYLSAKEIVIRKKTLHYIWKHNLVRKK